MSLEYQRYGRNKDTIVNKTYINSGEYRNKFNKITNNKEVNRVLYSKAKEMLQHRSGTMFEDMYWIDGDTGEIIASALNEQNESRIEYTQKILQAINKRSNIIAMHTHPSSMPPSVADFNSAFKHNYKINLIICHNGTVFCYESNEIVDTILYNAYLKKYYSEGYTEYKAQIATLNQIKKNFDIKFREVKDYE